MHIHLRFCTRMYRVVSIAGRTSWHRFNVPYTRRDRIQVFISLHSISPCTPFSPHVSFVKLPLRAQSPALDCGLDDRGSSPGKGQEFFSSPPRPDRLWRPTSLLSSGYQEELSLGIKQPGLTTHLHLVPRSRMRGAILSLPQYAFMPWCSVKAQGQLYLYLYYFDFAVFFFFFFFVLWFYSKSSPANLILSLISLL
jgi:hypothetical protein